MATDDKDDDDVCEWWKSESARMVYFIVCIASYLFMTFSDRTGLKFLAASGAIALTVLLTFYDC